MPCVKPLLFVVLMVLPPLAASAAPATSQPEAYQAWPFNAKEAAKRQDETAKALGIPMEMTLDLADKVQMKFILIPAGRFMMGSTKQDMDLAHQLNVKYGNKEGIYDSEMPQHEVTLTKPFYMSIYHVTKAQFAAFVADANYKTGCEKGTETYVSQGKSKDASWKNPGFEQGDDHPVVCLNWFDADAFCKWMTGRTIGLPMETQWEYACRAGVATMFLWGDDLGAGAGWCNIWDRTTQTKLPSRSGTPISWSDNYVFTSPVGKFKPNNFGLYDMIGNAEQWCADWWGKDYYKNCPKVDPPPSNDSSNGRNRRGASWSSKWPRIAFRQYFRPEVASDNFGMRVICTDVEPK